jgi:hypothetical protein
MLFSDSGSGVKSIGVDPHAAQDYGELSSERDLGHGRSPKTTK